MKELRLVDRDIIIAVLSELGLQYTVGYDVEQSIKYEYVVANGSVDGVEVYVKCEPESSRKSYCEVENPEFRHQGALKIVEPRQLKNAILEVVALAKQLKQRLSELVALTEMLKESGFEIAAFANHVEAFKSYGGASYIRIYMDASSRVSIVLQVLDIEPRQAVELAKKLDSLVLETLKVSK
ncbi:MAG: hypothetical protein LM568_00110 [Desulfurococcaceae archaeon]|nr:hypothetical protein [Desulfurococcaceae archaeon]